MVVADNTSLLMHTWELPYMAFHSRKLRTWYYLSDNSLYKYTASSNNIISLWYDMTQSVYHVIIPVELVEIPFYHIVDKSPSFYFIKSSTCF